MKKTRLSDSQIMEVLKRDDAGVKVPDLCRELVVSSATFYKCRAKFGGVVSSISSRGCCSQYKGAENLGVINANPHGCVHNPRLPKINKHSPHLLKKRVRTVQSPHFYNSG